MVKSKLKMFAVAALSFVTAVCLLTNSGNVSAEPASTVEEAVSVPIIMYHSLLNDTQMLNDYTCSPALFEDDLEYLSENGYTTVTVSDLTAYVYQNKHLPEKCIMLTFDDGYYNNYCYAYPLLKKYNCKAVISPIVSMTEKFTKTEDISPNYGHISVDDIIEMSNSGYVEFQNHSYNMHKLTPRRGIEKKYGESEEDYKAAVADDITKAQIYLKEKANINASAFVYPFGAESESTLQIIKELGFRCTLTCTEKQNYITHNPDSLYELGRYRRDNDETIQQLLDRIGTR